MGRISSQDYGSKTGGGKSKGLGKVYHGSTKWGDKQDRQEKKDQSKPMFEGMDQTGGLFAGIAP